MLLPNRNGSTEANGYRYGFQGQEKDDEIKGDGNSLNYKYRMHDPRVGRFFAVDPLEGKFPWLSPYSFSGNRVIDATELEGREIDFVIWDPTKGGYIQTHKIHTIEKISKERPIELLTDLFGWTVTETIELKDIGITWTFINYENSWRLVPENKLNQSLYSITKEEWDSFNTPDNVNTLLGSIEGLGQKAELAVNLVMLGDGLKNLYGGFRLKGKSRKKVANKYPDDPIPSTGKKFGAVSVKGGKVEVDGKVVTYKNVDFVIDTNGNLQLGRKHQALSNNGDVLGAGTMKIVDGKIKRIDNLSGHYQPNSAEFWQAIDVLHESGVDINGARLQLYKFDVPEGQKPKLIVNLTVKRVKG